MIKAPSGSDTRLQMFRKIVSFWLKLPLLPSYFWLSAYILVISERSLASRLSCAFDTVSATGRAGGGGGIGGKGSKGSVYGHKGGSGVLE